jgi:nucleoside phosphorylase
MSFTIICLPSNPKDSNAYTLGSIGPHNVVAACLRSGVYGNNSAVEVATHMLNSFESIRFGLMVGIGGGVPSRENDIRLGDVVVSKPTKVTLGIAV